MKKLVKRPPKKDNVNSVISNDISIRNKGKGRLIELKSTRKKNKDNKQNHEKNKPQLVKVRQQNKRTSSNKKSIHPILSEPLMQNKRTRQNKVNHPKKKEVNKVPKNMEIALLIPIKSNKVKKQIKSTILPQKLEEKPVNPQIKPRIIDLEEINNKFLATYTNFDYLLSIMEIVNNKEFYNIPFSDKSKYFWEKVITTKECDKIFAGFKPETLRKYWSLLNKGDNLECISSIIMKIKENDQAKKIKLKTLVNWLTTLKDNADIEKSLYDLIQKELKLFRVIDKSAKKQKKTTVVKKKTTNESKPLDTDGEKTRKRIYKFVLEEENSDERQKYLCVNEVIETFKDIFKHKKYSESFILDGLNINSMNIENTYNYLLNPNGISKSIFNLDKCFNSTEDYTIQNMKQSAHYLNLLEKKGELCISEREAYLTN